MKIEKFSDEPELHLPFLNAGRGAGQFYQDDLAVHRAWVDKLPAETDAILVTADLQGRELLNPKALSPPKLLGEVLPRQLVDDVLPQVIGPIDPQRIGVFLAGDFYTVPNLDSRGGTGDVSEVWRAFGETFGWVAGVAGNHDLFGGDRPDPNRLPANCHYFDGTMASINGLKVAGLGGVIGNPRRPHRRFEDDYLDTLANLLDQRPDILITHEGPPGPQPKQPGMPTLRDVLQLEPPPLLIRGHKHWDIPFGQYDDGSQILNVDCRLVILTRH